MKKIIDLENDLFQAQCAVNYLHDYVFEEGATIRHVRDDVVTLDLADGTETTVNLEPVQTLLDGLRRLT